MFKKKKFLRLSQINFIVAISLLALIPIETLAQRRRVENMATYDYAKYHFGFILAVNQMHFTIKPI